ncbi:hypothetical protein ABZ897_12120 [Nonomuraea sp. NPDC046802]|uniref:hypothetical protein n=1 Tax=Nonomuraea sp. NPDC046802 TaxID=3154919 RepID=UPI0033C9C7DC
MPLKKALATIATTATVMAGLMTGSPAASAAPAAQAADCNGYEPHAYAPGRNGDVITGIGSCGRQTITVEVWIDVSGGFDKRVGCCPRGTSPVTAYAYCSRSGRGNYYTVARTPMGTVESARRLLC